MKKQRPSIKDIASELNVSVTTVSFVLNGKAKEKKISDEVSRKISEYSKKINYTPNRLAQSLRTGKSRILVFMVEDISNYFFAKLARIIEDIAYQQGYNVLFCSNENNDEKSIELLKLFRDRQVDGYIIIPSAGIRDNIAALLKENIPVVLFDRYFPDLETNYVIIDNEDASYSATKHLIDNKFKQIGFITLKVNQTQMIDRLSGYEKAIKENDLTPNILQLTYKEIISGQAKQIIHQFFIDKPQLDSIYFATNYLTQSGLEVINENFPALLNELGILTFDDHELFGIYHPSISAVSQPLEEIGGGIMDIMLNLLKEKNVSRPNKGLVLETELMVRDSSLPKSNG